MKLTYMVCITLIGASSMLNASKTPLIDDETPEEMHGSMVITSDKDQATRISGEPTLRLDHFDPQSQPDSTQVVTPLPQKPSPILYQIQVQKSQTPARLPSDKKTPDTQKPWPSCTWRPTHNQLCGATLVLGLAGIVYWARKEN